MAWLLKPEALEKGGPAEGGLSMPLLRHHPRSPDYRTSWSSKAVHSGPCSEAPVPLS